MQRPAKRCRASRVRKGAGLHRALDWLLRSRLLDLLVHRTLALLLRGSALLPSSAAGRKRASEGQCCIAGVVLCCPAASRPLEHPCPNPSPASFRPAAVGGMLPAVLGLVFVGVALLSWNRVQHWRRRGGAGYQPAGTGRAGAAAGQSQLTGEGHLGAALEHRAGPLPASATQVEHV